MAIDPKFLRYAGQTLSDLGVGVTRGYNFRNGLQQATQRTAEMQPQRDAWAVSQQAEAKRQEQLAAAVENMRKYNPQIADIVASGGMDPQTGWNEVLRGMQPQAAPSPMEINGQLVNPQTGEVLGDYRTAEAPEAPSYPSGYQGDPNNPNGMTYVPGGPADPATVDALRPPVAPKPPTEAQQRMGMINNIVQDEAKVLLGDPATGQKGVYAALGDVVNQGLDANVFGQNPGRAFTSADYQRAVSAIETISQHYLYALSGQAAPDGEVKRVARTLMPVVGENPASVLEKKRRLESYLQTIESFVQQTGGQQQPTGQTFAVNPQTGERLMLQNGQWVPAQ